MQWFLEIVVAILDKACHVLLYPLDPSNRIYWLYLLSSAFAAYLVYRAIKSKSDHVLERDAEAAKGTFLQFLFPKSVWSHPSAWLDLRYVFVDRVVTHSLILVLGSFATALGYRLMSGEHSLDDVVKQEHLTTVNDWFIASIYMVVVMFLMDFIAWFMHFLQHKSSLLWQFHKVHHSAEVMHPISNYREHPVDNIGYSFFIGLGYGAVYAFAVRFLGFVPTTPTLLGVPLLMFLFNVAAYNLRHSHVWLRWPGIWSIVFPSPAHHHVHHSCHPDHIDKNFAFMFPLWDVIFGTYLMPDDNRDVKFGVTEGDGEDLDGVLKLYWVPFRDAYRLFRGKSPKKSKQNLASSDSLDEEPKQPDSRPR